MSQRHVSIRLAGYTMGSSFKAQMSAADDFFYIDDLQIAL
jgi:hypothetical protein